MPRRNVGELGEDEIRNLIANGDGSFLGMEGSLRRHPDFPIDRQVPNNWKADVGVVHENDTWLVSIKDFTGAPPTLMNHTHRGARVFLPGGQLHDILPQLDRLAAEYVRRRRDDDMGEDVRLDGRFDCMSDPVVREAIIQLLLYFTFTGSGSGPSPKQANSMIVREKDGAIHFHRCATDEEKRNYITSILHRIKISFRNKGMPRNPTEVHEPWIFREERPDGTVKVKGSMHLRFYC